MGLPPFRPVALAAFTVLAGGGCATGGAIPTYPVTGTVLVGDRPATGAVVTLVPAGGPRGDPAPQGVVREDGSFAVSTFRPGDGAPAGEYAVRVEWRDHTRPGAGKKGAPHRDKFGGRYSAEKSGLRVSVRPGDNPLPPFRLAAPK